MARSSKSMTRWCQICQDINLDELDDRLKEVKTFQDLSLLVKLETIDQTDHMFEKSFECYLWCERKISCLKYLAIFSSPPEERIDNIKDVYEALYDTDQPIDVEKEDPQLFHALQEYRLDQEIEDAIELYGEPDTDDFKGLPLGLVEARMEREQVYRKLRPILDTKETDLDKLLESLKLAETREAYLVLCHDWKQPLIEKLGLITTIYQQTERVSKIDWALIQKLRYLYVK